jgi:hypothetical protein
MVWWHGAQGEWTGTDVPDFVKTKRPDYRPDWSKHPAALANPARLREPPAAREWRPRMTQRPQAVANVRIDEPHVRVTEWRFVDGAETGWHRHGHDYVVVPMLDGALLLEEPGGGTRTVPLKAHAPYTRLAGVEHNVINASGHEFAFLEIELLR